MDTTDEWYNGLDDDFRAALDSYINTNSGGLVKALEREKEQRLALEQQAKELNTNVEIAAQIEKIRGDLADKEQRIAFYQAAANAPDLPNKHLDAAFKLAQLDGLITDAGVQWDALRANHDYLFIKEDKRVIAGNAGNGVGTKPQPRKDMNALIRGSR